MKKYFFLLVLIFTLCKFSTAQILCIYCYDQNDTISAGVNNLLLNGGFENGTCTPFPPIVSFCPNSSLYSCDITNWTCTGGGTSTYACILDSLVETNIVEGIYGAYFGNNFCNACSTAQNDTSCINNIGCTVTGIPAGYPFNPHSGYGGATGVSLEQTVNGLTAGNVYVLEFWAGGEFFGSVFTAPGLFALNVGFGDTLLRNKATEPVTGIGTRYIIEFIATSSSHTIKFTNWGHICQGCTELVLDDVRLYTQAELDGSVPHCSVGINNSDFQNEENIFPNPVTNELNITTNTNDVSEIILYDIFSKKLLQQTFINSASINTSAFSKGIYFYEIRNKEGAVKKGKVVKE